ncbi:microtubule-destabilizing protein 60 [Malania oleifera]|uniref:microtubule-destabilizing protein 60 n=1 Tax=Malania oleifera TaxID=397392 RepID=UPI0025AE421C|nr:microtubule-destabilizing protein 60 [Malania oleifera]
MMDSNGKNAGSTTPAKTPQPHRSKIQEVPKISENLNPNFGIPGSKPSSSPAIKSAKSQKSAPRMANPVASPRNKIRERKFVVAKKNPNKKKAGVSAVTCRCKEKNGGNVHKCLCMAYENLRVSQEEFFKNRDGMDDQCDWDQPSNCERAELAGDEEKKNPSSLQNPKTEEAYGLVQVEEGDFLVMNETIEPAGGVGTSTVKRRRDKLLEEARESVPEAGSGRVMHLVKAFERLLSMPRSKESDQTEEKESEESTKRGMKWALPGLQPKAPETRESLSSLCPSELFLTSENLGLDSQVSSSWDSSRGSISSRTSCGGRRSRRNNTESSGTAGGRKWRRRQLKATSQKPFKLRTEQRGRCKEEEFIRKVQEMIMEEEKMRIPTAQGLPWTTDEPECLMKPQVKECTRPLNVKLHSDVRAVERAGFDQQVAEKMSLIEQYKMEKESQQKLEEEEEVKRLRKELIPKAQPMPYFDRPFIPRRSMKHPTIPREPNFHIPNHKKIKCCLSWNDINIYDYNHHH